jgi:hypothetical protein
VIRESLNNKMKFCKCTLHTSILLVQVVDLCVRQNAIPIYTKGAAKLTETSAVCGERVTRRVGNRGGERQAGSWGR